MELTITKSNKIETTFSFSAKECASFICPYLSFIDFSVKPRSFEYTHLTDSYISYAYTLPNSKLLSLSGKVSEVLPVVNFIYSYYQTFLEYSL